MATRDNFLVLTMWIRYPFMGFSFWQEYVGFKDTCVGLTDWCSDIHLNLCWTPRLQYGSCCKETPNSKTIMKSDKTELNRGLGDFVLALTGKDLMFHWTTFFSGIHLVLPVVVLNLGESASLGTGTRMDTWLAVDRLLNWLRACGRWQRAQWKIDVHTHVHMKEVFYDYAHHSLLLLSCMAVNVSNRWWAQR